MKRNDECVGYAICIQNWKDERQDVKIVMSFMSVSGHWTQFKGKPEIRIETCIIGAWGSGFVNPTERASLGAINM
jgi:hypothetical protein